MSVSAASTLSPKWLAALQARANTAPLKGRVPLQWQGQRIGSVEPEFLEEFAALPLQDGRSALCIQEQAQGASRVETWHVQGDLTTSLALLASAMRAAGVCGAWRNEQLAVRNDAGQVLGTIERGAVRPLGITTHAVHLLGWVGGGGAEQYMWVQQRAWDKPNDPGMWDTLMGGMVPASDALQVALERETWEEAGLRLADLPGVRHGGQVHLRRPTTEAQHPMGGAGYMQERIDWFSCQVPVGLEPQNQDGEVAQFALWSLAEIMAALQRDAFTTEASLVLVDALSGFSAP